MTHMQNSKESDDAYLTVSTGTLCHCILGVLIITHNGKEK